MVDCYDVAVIGGGVVGCGVARACALAGRKTVLIEREAALASSHAAVWPLKVVSTVMAAFDPGVAGGDIGGGQGGVACGKEGGS